MAKRYILKGKCPVEEPDLIKWGRWLGKADRTVKRTAISDDVTISTVFIGLGSLFGDGPALLFETLIFGGDQDGDMWRYSTWDEAEAGHDAAVKLLQKVPNSNCGRVSG